MFMSALLLHWDASARRFVYTGAGHEHLLIYHAKQRACEAVRAGGIALGLMADASGFLHERELPLERGDAIVLYTDGVTEARDPKGEPYGLDKLVATVSDYGHLGAKDLLEAVLYEVKAHAGGADAHDDLTLVTVKRR
jgi:sigma-B regulation protein RsbU (phosphoserine phosphatase)